MTEKRSASSSVAPRATAAGPNWVLLDTNALFLPVRTALDLTASIERWVERPRIAVPQAAIDELDRLSGLHVEDAAAAREVARRFPTVPSSGGGDAAIVEVALRLRAWVVTGDADLRERLVKWGIRVLFPRGRSALSADARGRHRPSSRQRL